MSSNEKINNTREEIADGGEAHPLEETDSFEEHMAKNDLEQQRKPDTEEKAVDSEEESEIGDSDTSEYEEIEEEKKRKIKEIQTARQLIGVLRQASVGSQSAMAASAELAELSQQIESVINGSSQEDAQKLVDASMQRLQYLKNEKFMMFPRQFEPALRACDNVMKILRNL